jgi:hypothetical protein
MRKLFILALVASALGQSLPDAPKPQPKCGPWSCWENRQADLTTKQVFRTKSFYAMVFTDLAASSFDAEMSHAYNGHPCVEGNHDLPLHPTRWELYKENIPENAAVIVTAFVFTKVHVPKWLDWAALAYPVQLHLRAGIGWVGCH